ncbi:MAG: signal peptidase I [Candidatus Heimdallarchaeota archaeon]|nr:signal peptidase I [Candidatus Heimdallarchaeota archaeon]MCK5049540.1 signal peptidase I [Candidatus Heimdallarchaeota archaeon]
MSSTESKSKKSEINSSVIWFVGIILAVFVLKWGFAFFGFSFVVISNPDPNSMHPTYFQGDVFLLYNAKPENIKVGDVIVYDAPSKSELIIHRVISIFKHNNSGTIDYYYRVKGDNPITNSFPDHILYNDFLDKTLIPYDYIVGKCLLRIPKVGLISLQMQDDQTFRYAVYLLIAFLAAFIIFWPEDDEEDNKDDNKKENDNNDSAKIEEEPEIINPSEKIETAIKVEKTTPTAVERLISYYKKSSNWFNSHKKIGYVIIIFVLLSSMIVVDSLNKTDRETGIMHVIGTNRDNNYQSYAPEMAFSFIQLNVTLSHDGSFFKILKEFTIQTFVLDGGEELLIEETRWHSYRQFEGVIVVGGSAFVPLLKLPGDFTTTSNYTIIFRVSCTVRTGFWDSYESSIDYTLYNFYYLDADY